MHRAPTPVIPMKMGIYSILFCLLVPAGVCNALYLSFLFPWFFSIFLTKYAILDTQCDIFIPLIFPVFFYLFFRFLNSILSLHYKEGRHMVCSYKRLKVAKRCQAPFGNFYSKKRQTFYRFPFNPLSFNLLFLFFTRYSILYTRYYI